MLLPASAGVDHLSCMVGKSRFLRRGFQCFKLSVCRCCGSKLKAVVPVSKRKSFLLLIPLSVCLPFKLVIFQLTPNALPYLASVHTAGCRNHKNSFVFCQVWMKCLQWNAPSPQKAQVDRQRHFIFVLINKEKVKLFGREMFPSHHLCNERLDMLTGLLTRF